jgi:hypothetical protein
MMKLHLLILACWGSVVAAGFGSPTAAGEISIERGLQVSILGGCHDCHTEGYRAGKGKIDPAKAMKGSSIGWQGPWGTTYAQNLRLTAATISEDGFVSFYRDKAPEMLPPMPWYRLNMISEDDFRSLYRYLRSLGEPGKPVPGFVPPGDRVNTPYIVFDPPQQPPSCTRDFDCGVGEICGKAEPRTCARRE